MNIIVCDNYSELSKTAAGIVAEAISGKKTCLGLATGSTPEGMYDCLAELYESGKCDFSGVVTFNLDEYYKIGADRALMPGGFTRPENVINCRCTHVDIVGDIDPQIRRGRNPHTGENEVFEFKTYEQWAKDNGLKQDKNGAWSYKG